MNHEIKIARSVALKYFIRVKNIGDQINPIVIKQILGREVFWHNSDNTEKHLMAIGSILESATPKSYVWGSGLMFAKNQNLHINPTNILALRGKKTRDNISKNTTLKKEIPLGDPGYLAPEILGYGTINKKNKKYRLGIVPHYVDYLNPLLQNFVKENPDVTIIDVALKPKFFFEKMSDCENIISSSLHGLIFAEALHIPSLWCEFSSEVVGNGFKFADWYSLCDNIQKKPVRLTTKKDFKNILNIIKYCSLGNPNIDKQALIDALQRTNYDAFSYNKKLLPVEKCREEPTPVFIISYNRGSYLKKVISSYQRQSSNIDIIIHDNGSDEKETQETLKNLEKQGVKVHYNKKINNADELNNASQTINNYFKSWSEPQEYIVTDCNIELSKTHPEAIKLYSHILNKFRTIECVGPMLTIIDIPNEYPLKRRVFNKHTSQFWHKKPKKLQDDRQDIFYIFVTIDTTFALYRAGSKYKRLTQGIRVYNPYEAKNLNWYITDEKQQEYYSISSSKNISYLNNKKQITKERDTSLIHRSLYLVEKNNGRYNIKRVALKSIWQWLFSIYKK